MNPDILRVLIIANDPLARAGLATLLTTESNYTIAGQVAGDTDLLADLDIYQPDVVIWDLGWDPVSALDHLENYRDINFPMVALLPDETFAAEVWASGIQCLILRDAGVAKLLASLQAAVQGLAIFEPGLIPVLSSGRPLEPELLTEALTPRELEVLQLLAEGLANKAIARQLGISEHTVKFHVNAILGKLNAQSRTEAVVRATRLGLLHL